jgi:CubicO group peptidase (beta-lactamase class C family)
MKKHSLKRLFQIPLLIGIASLCSCSTDIKDIAGMSSREMIEYTTKGVKNAAITVGIVRNGGMSFTVYGENGRVRQNREHVYEIASITKSFTSALFSKAVSENRVNLDDTIDLFLDLPKRDYYPTIKRLLTHTSGYAREYYFGYVSSTNFGIDGNYHHNGVTEKLVLNRIGTIKLEDRDYPFAYSNFGYAVAGLVLKGIYNEEYTSLINSFLRNDLGLFNTRVSDGSGDLSHYILWGNNNPFNATGALVSTATDLMKYAQMQTDETPPYLSLPHNVFVRRNPQINIPELEIYADAYGLGWDIDNANNIIMHGGDFMNYNCFLIIDKANSISVVVLSNMAYSFRANARAICATTLKELKNEN